MVLKYRKKKSSVIFLNNLYHRAVYVVPVLLDIIVIYDYVNRLKYITIVFSKFICASKFLFHMFSIKILVL